MLLFFFLRNNEVFPEMIAKGESLPSLQKVNPRIQNREISPIPGCTYVRLCVRVRTMASGSIDTKARRFAASMQINEEAKTNRVHCV